MKTILLDDDQCIIDILEPMMREISNDSVYCFTKSENLLRDLDEGKVLPELVLMDIKLGKTSGIDVAARILDEFPEAQIVFISGYDDYYLDVYDVDHIYFLRKPITEEGLRRAYDRAVNKGEDGGNQVFEFRFRQTSYMVPYRDILFFENNRRKVLLHTSKSHEPHIFYEKMDDIMPRLDKRFVRCHKSYIVNIAGVDIYRKGKFIIGSRNIPISRTYAKECQEAFENFIESGILHEAE